MTFGKLLPIYITILTNEIKIEIEIQQYFKTAIVNQMNKLVQEVKQIWSEK